MTAVAVCPDCSRGSSAPHRADCTTAQTRALYAAFSLTDAITRYDEAKEGSP